MMMMMMTTVMMEVHNGPYRGAVVHFLLWNPSSSFHQDDIVSSAHFTTQSRRSQRCILFSPSLRSSPPLFRAPPAGLSLSRAVHISSIYILVSPPHITTLLTESTAVEPTFHSRSRLQRPYWAFENNRPSATSCIRD